MKLNNPIEQMERAQEAFNAIVPESVLESLDSLDGVSDIDIVEAVISAYLGSDNAINPN